MTTDKSHTDGEERWEHPIVADVRTVRDEIAAQFDYDIDRIVRHISKWGEEHRRNLATLRDQSRKLSSGSGQ